MLDINRKVAEYSIAFATGVGIVCEFVCPPEVCPAEVSCCRRITLAMLQLS